VAHWDVLDKSDLLSQLRIDRGADRPPRRRTGLYVIVGLAVALLGGGLWFGVLRARPPVVQTAVARAAAQAGGAGSVLDASGYVTARRQATVSAKITGKVTEVLIEEGQRVREGAVLARLDDTEAQAQLGLTRAQLTAARSQLAEVQAQLVQAERDHARMLAELKHEVGRLVVQTTASVTGKILTPEDHQRLAEETARQLAS